MITSREMIVGDDGEAVFIGPKLNAVSYSSESYLGFTYASEPIIAGEIDSEIVVLLRPPNPKTLNILKNWMESLPLEKLKKGQQFNENQVRLPEGLNWARDGGSVYYSRIGALMERLRWKDHI